MKNESTRKVINVDKPNYVPLFEFKELDNAVIRLSLFKASVEFDITGQTVKLGAKTSKGLKEQSEGFTINKNNLDIDLKNSILVPGTVEIDLELKDASGTMTTASFFITVKSKVLNDKAVEGTNEFDTFTKTAAKIEEDYKGLRRIIIDENQAANLQDQVNQTNAQLETNMQQINGIETNTNSIKLIAHRGLSGLAPENTLPAYELAGKYGYWGAETDVMETSDGYFILMHDTTVDRTTNGTGAVSDLTLSQIKNLIVDTGSNISKYPNLKVPTMEEYLNVCKKYNLIPVIEIKSISNVDNFLEILKKYNVLHSCIIISYDWDLLWRIRLKNSFVKMQGVSDTLDIAKIDRAISYKVDISAHYSQGKDKTLVDYAHSKGLSVATWTVNTESLYEECKNANIDFITTDNIKDLNEVRQVIGDYSILNTNNTMSYILNVVYNSMRNTGIVIKNTNIILGMHSGYLNKPFEQQWAVSTTRARGQNFNIDGAKKFKIEFNSSKYSMTILCYNADNYFIKDIGWLSEGEHDFETNTYFALMYFKKSDGSDITESDMLDIIQSSKLTLLY